MGSWEGVADMGVEIVEVKRRQTECEEARKQVKKERETEDGQIKGGSV